VFLIRHWFDQKHPMVLKSKQDLKTIPPSWWLYDKIFKVKQPGLVKVEIHTLLTKNFFVFIGFFISPIMSAILSTHYHDIEAHKLNI
jgi:hypothetical protein